jgi:hypothetical protein
MAQYCVSPSRALGVVCPALCRLVLARPLRPPRKFPRATTAIPWSCCILPFDVVHVYAFLPGIAVPPLASPRLPPAAPPSRRILGTLALCAVRILCPQSVPSHVSLHVAHALAVRHHCARCPHRTPSPAALGAPARGAPPVRNSDCVPCTHALYGAVVRCPPLPRTCVRSAAARPRPRTRPPHSAARAALHPLLLRCALPALATCV